MNSSVPSIGQGRLACAIGLTFALLLVSSSSALALTVRQIGVKANDILYEKVSGKLYVLGTRRRQHLCELGGGDRSGNRYDRELRLGRTRAQQACRF